VAKGQVGKANAVVAATSTACGAVGYGLAGIVLALAATVGLQRPTNLLFIADGTSFALAALLVAGVANLGGGTIAMRLTGSFRRTWGIQAARQHLAIGALAAFLIAISFPALLALAYKLNGSQGPTPY